MDLPPPSAPLSGAESWKRTAWAAGLIVGTALLAYHNTYHCPFEFDDIPAIVGNDTIEHLGSLKAIFSPPLDMTVSGRPVLNLSFALNYAISGRQVWSYHALNLAIHILAGLTLFGIVRRTLGRTAKRVGDNAFHLALAIALLWTLHPLQTESVTYIVQRAEALMGLFYLLTLYCFIRASEVSEPLAHARGHDDARGHADAHGHDDSRGHEATGSGCERERVVWYALSFIFCLLGIATKEVAVSAPIIVLLYDRTFLAGSFKEGWRRRRGVYLALFATWIPLACLVWSTGNRSGTVGFGIDVGWRQYWITQFPAIVRYIKLSLMPVGLVFDYGTQWVRLTGAVLRDIAIVGVLGLVTLVGLYRRLAIGFLGFWFFAILAPTSIIPGNRQTLAEHRMYLALAAVIIVVVMGLEKSYEWWLRRRGGVASGVTPPVVLFLALAAVAGWLTERRNNVYRSDLALWADTVTSCPLNPYARNNLGNMFMLRGWVPAAVREYQIALQIKPDYAESRNNLGTALVTQGKVGAAEAEFRAALDQKNKSLGPSYGAEVHSNLAVALFRLGNVQGALAEFQEALRLKPDYTEGHINYGNALGKLGRTGDAIEQYQEAIRLKPGYADVHNNLGNVLLNAGRRDEALTEYETALRLRPDYVEAHYNLGSALYQARRPEQAIDEFVKALQLKPSHAPSRLGLANALVAEGRLQEAYQQYRLTVQIQPDYAEAHCCLGDLLLRVGRTSDAVAQFTTAMALWPDYPEAHNSLGSALLMEGKIADAKIQIETALRIRPGWAEAYSNLGGVAMLEGRPEEAAEHFRKALSLGLDLPEVHNNLGAALERLGRNEEAADQFRAALRLDPNYVRARTNLAKLLAPPKKQPAAR